MREEIDITEPRSLGDILSDGIKYFIHNIGPFARIAMLYGLPVVLLLVVVFFLIDLDPYFMQSAAEELGIDFLFATSVYSLASLVITLLVGTAGLAYIDVKRVEGHRPNDKSVFNRFISLLPAMLLIGLISIIIYGLLGGLIAIPIIMEAYVISIFLLPVVFIVLFYLSVPLALYPATYAFSGYSIADSLQYIFQLIRGNWWYSFGTLFILTIIVSVASYIFVMPVYIFQGLDMFSSIEDGTTTDFIFYQKMQYLLSSIGSIASILFYLPAMSMLYFTLVEKKEHTTLKRKIEEAFDNADEHALD